MEKSLKSKAIDIKGNQYVLVSDRIIYFNEKYEDGSIKTSLLSEPDAEMVVVKAKVTPESGQPDRYFTGLSQAKWGEGMVNKTAALENAETSAVGRALAMMGIGVIDSVASVDEMSKAGATDLKKVTGGATKKQVQTIIDLRKQGKLTKEEAKEVKEKIDNKEYTKQEASDLIGKALKRKSNFDEQVDDFVDDVEEALDEK